MICSFLSAVWLCVQQPIICNQQIYDKKAIFTAYTLSEDETDGSPEIGAGNHNLREYQERGVRVCASRILPLHTKIYIMGIGECEILDRTSKKYADRIDLLVQSKEEAFRFGLKELEYIIIK
jgi:3D (Asp-Asp-Asp) domain-containing protein